MAWLFFSAYTILSGLQQGLICWLLREYVPPGRKEWIDAAYHYGGTLIYAVLVLYVAHGTSWRQAAGLVAGALLLRALLFDVSLNAARAWFDRREGRPPGPLFEVGTMAATDRLIRWLAGGLHLAPDRLRFVLWLLALGAVGILVIL